MGLTWSPSRRQESFIQIPDSVREGFFGGAAGGGKSEILLMLPIARQFYEAPRFKGILFRRTYPELEKSLILRSQSDGFYKGTGGEYNKQIRRWTWPSGAVLDFGYAEHEEDVRKYDTTEYNYIGWDELTSFTEFQYMYITQSRLRTSDENLPAICRAGSNPGNIGHGWVRKRFVEPAPYGTIIRDSRTGHKRIFIQSLVTDNPYLMKADPEYINALRMLPESERKAKLEGDWWTFSGQVFEDWRVEPFSDEPDNARHVIPPFSIPPYWPRILAIDWGFAALNYCMKVAITPQKRVVQYYEQVDKQTKISDWGSTLRLNSSGETFVGKVLDPSAWQQTGATKTVATQIMEETGFTFDRADNDRVGGKTLVQEYLRWRPKETRAAQEGIDVVYAQNLLRYKGTEAYNKYVDAFVPDPPETNLPKFQVFDTCTEMKKVLPLCVYDKDHVEDVAQFKGDDPYDCLRYALKEADHYLHLATRGLEEIEATDQVLNDFEKTGDYNTFHRRMDNIERKFKHTPMRRHHHANVATRAF